MKRLVDEHTFSVLTIVLLCVVLWYPQVLSASGIGFVIAWAYGLLTAKIVRILFRYCMMHWNIRRSGILLLSSAVIMCGVVCMYYGYTQSWYALLAGGWVLFFAGVDTTYHTYYGGVARLNTQLLTALEYLVVALFMLALFGAYIATTPVGQLGFEYQGLQGESLIFIALVMLVCEVLHDSWRYFDLKVRRFLTRR